MATKIHSSKRKERPVTGVLKQTPSKKIVDDDPDRKRSRALQKLLRQIEVLAHKDAAGEPLDDAQREKLGRFDAVVAELEELMGNEQQKQESEEEEDSNRIEREEDDKLETDDEEDRAVAEAKSKPKQRSVKENRGVHSKKRKR